MEYQNRHRKVLEDHFLPAYQLLIDGLEELKGTGSNENGLCWLKGGKDYYRYLLAVSPASTKNRIRSGNACRNS